VHITFIVMLFILLYLKTNSCSVSLKDILYCCAMKASEDNFCIHIFIQVCSWYGRTGLSVNQSSKWTPWVLILGYRW